MRTIVYRGPLFWETTISRLPYINVLLLLRYGQKVRLNVVALKGGPGKCLLLVATFLSVAC